MPGTLRTIVLTCAVAGAVSGCGGGEEGTIPSGESDQLLNQLDAIEDDVQSGNCDLAKQHAQDFAISVSELPEDVDPKVRQGLTQASTQIVELANDPAECEDTTGATGEDGPETSTTEVETTTSEEETPTTTSTDEETEPQPEEETEEEPSADPGSGEGNGPPLETPSGNIPGEGSGGRGSATEGGGITPEKAGRR